MDKVMDSGSIDGGSIPLRDARQERVLVSNPKVRFYIPLLYHLCCAVIWYSTVT
jgi:hypothetical protein